MAQLERRSDGTIEARFDVGETEVLRTLITQMRAVVTEDDRTDRLGRRLFPDAYDSIDDAEKYRSLVGDELKAAKLHALDTISGALAPGRETTVTIGGDDLDAWLTGLTDLRLGLGTLLGVTEETMGADIDPDAPDAGALAVLHWLGWLQESMLDHVVDRGDEPWPG